MTIETREEDMDHLMVQTELGITCVPFVNLEDYHRNKKDTCGEKGKCLLCKAINDVHEMNMFYNTEHTMGMTQWIKTMQTNEEWKHASLEKRFILTCIKLSTRAMEDERKKVAGYGAV
eukprot:5429447-Heterocapsa_arctica.AAC.1